MKRIPELDGLRGVAIILVLIWHFVVASISFEPGSLLSYASVFGRLSWSGVDLFFVLSGFLIGSILLEQRDAPRYFTTFYLRRGLRILPLYAVVLFGFGMLYREYPDSPLFANPLPLWSYATFTQNFAVLGREDLGPGWMGATWSLAVEEQFYLTLPIIIRLVRPTRLPYIFAFAVIGAPLLRSLLFFTYPHSAIATYVLMPCRADTLLMGVGLAYLVRSGRRFPMKYAYLTLAVSGAFLAVMAGKNIGWGSWQMTTLGYSLIGCFYSAGLILIINLRPFLFRMRLLTWMGTIAYGTYLIHPVMLGAFDKPLALLLTLTLAAASWIYFEKRLIQRGHKISYQRPGVEQSVESSGVPHIDSVRKNPAGR
jgi:peptidoglycan/LPS O-acetylase OafA/YrhL